MSLGKRVESEREARGWTQTQLAAKVPGLTQQALDVLEKRDSRTSQNAAALADALEISLRWLLTGQGRKEDRDWPFPRVARARWDACDDTDRGYIQAAVNKALDECEVTRADPRQGIRVAATNTEDPGRPVAGAKSGADEVRATRGRNKNERHHN